LVKPHLRFILVIVFAAVFAFSATMLILYYAQVVKEKTALKQLAAIAGNNMELPEPIFGRTPATALTPETPVILEQYWALHEQNADMVGWIKIDGTEIDYPVMHTADVFYLSHGFDKKESRSGVPFIDKRCTIEPFGTNTIIYGHHMKNGTMFAALENYKDEDYYKDHPAIRFDTLYEHQEYEIIAVFESQIYRKSETVFKHYNFLNAGGQTDFDEYIANIKALSLYDTGVTASCGDELLTLVTCAYHTENGQFVVVARKAG
jgi:sortase B